MYTSDATRFLRWGIPGWIAILSFVIFTVTDLLGNPDGLRKLNEYVGGVIAVTGQSSTAAAAILVAAAGLPLGFIIYQFYFFIRWNSPFSRDGLFPPFIVGRSTDLKRTLRDFTDSQIAGKDRWRKDWIDHPAYAQDHSFSWRYVVEGLVPEAIQKLDTRYNGTRINERYRYLLDILHTLGASIIGTYLAFLLYLIQKGFLERVPIITHSIFLGVVMGIFLFLLEKEDLFRQSRQSPDRIKDHPNFPGAVYAWQSRGWLKQIGAIEINHPAFLFLVIFAMTLFFVDPHLVSPTLDSNADGLFRIAMIVLFTLIWRKATMPDGEKNGIVLGMFVGIATNLLLRWQSHLLAWFDWSFLFPVFVFLVMNLTMLKNRQNARDDLSALQYYTLQRYLTEQADRPIKGTDARS
jgi:hypothetical protein